jgi:hypothetical protein
MDRSEYTANIQITATCTPAKVVQGSKKLFAGSVTYPLTQQIASTVEVHGLQFAASYYASKGLTQTEFLVLARGAGVLQ